MALETTSFFFNGRKSTDFGIVNCRIDSGMFEEHFLATKQIKETKVNGNPKPYYMGVDYEPLQFNLTFAFEDTWNEAKIREVARWLSVDTYKEFYLTSNINRIFYCQPVDSLSLIHNGLQSGYLTLTMKTNAPWSYSQVYTSQIYDFSTTSPNIITFVNEGDLDLCPYMWIYKVGNGDVSIVNLNDGGREFKFTGLVNAETVSIDNELEQIDTDVPLTYRYSNFNGNYLRLLYGVNNLIVTGNCKIKFRYQFRTLQG